MVGESGSGKSVFLKLIKELEKPTKGSIEKISEGRLKNIRYIPQKDFMFEATLDFNISFDQRCDNLSLLKKRVEINNNFPADIELRGENLSGGQAKRIAIARGLFCDDSLLLFDEPFQGLSEQQAKTIEKNILINRSPVIISSHQIYDQNLKYYNKFFIVKDKNIIVYNTLSEFLECDYYRKNKIDSQ